MGVTRTVKKAGTGPIPKVGEKVTIHCTGYLAAQRKKFWSTLDDNQPFSFSVGLGQVVKGFDEGLLQMNTGETADILMSSDYAYGKRGFPAWGIPPDTDLLFEITLLKIDPAA